MEQIVRLASTVMMSKSDSIQLDYTNKPNILCCINFRSLEECLGSVIGREYFYRYLKQHCCPEITVYLELMNKFKNQYTDSQRYFVAKDIIKQCISTHGKFQLNISYKTRLNALNLFNALPSLNPEIPVEFFNDVEIEMRRLIVTNYWKKFLNGVLELSDSLNPEIC